MSVRAMAAVWEMNLEPTKKFVLLTYADFADDEGRNIFPAVGTVARKTGLSKRTVQRITRELEAAGRLVLGGTGPRGTRRWSIPLRVGGDNVTPLDTGEGVTTATRGVTTTTSGGDVAMSPEPSINHQEPLTRPSGRARTDPERAELEKHFSGKTGLPVPKTSTDKQRKAAGALWYAPLREYLELGGGIEGARKLVAEVVRRMRKDGLTISDPNSTIKIARAVAAEGKLKADSVPDFIPPSMRA